MSLTKAFELRQKRAQLIAEAQRLLSGNITTESRQSAEAMLNDADTMQGDIARIERAATLEAELRQTTTPPNGQPVPYEQTEQRRAAHSKAFRNYLATGNAAELRTYAPMGVGSSGAGQEYVPQSFFSQLESALKTFGGVREVATVLPTSTGNDLILPTSNDTSNAGELVAENDPVGQVNPTTGRVILNAYKYSTKAVQVSIELIQDSEFDIESYISKIFAERIGRITNLHFTTGDGSAKPRGIVAAATAGPTAASQTAITYDDLVELEHSVDAAYRKGARFQFADAALKSVKKLKDSDGRPLWVPGVAVKSPDTILGYEFNVNQDIAAPAAGTKSVLFGQLSKYVVRAVREITVQRLNELYAMNGQVGFIGFARYDGDLIDAGTHPVKYLTMAA